MMGEKTFTATIYLSLTEGYGGKEHDLPEVRTFLWTCFKDYFCVSVTPTEFVYKGGFEAGVSIGIINYPRNPLPQITLRNKTLALAEKLMRHFKQERLSIVFQDETIMLERKQTERKIVTPISTRTCAIKEPKDEEC